MKKVTFHIDGMTCQGCAGKVRSILSGVDGVKDFNVNLDKKFAKIIYNDKSVSQQNIFDKLNETSFRIQLDQEPFDVSNGSFLQKIKNAIS